MDLIFCIHRSSYPQCLEMKYGQKQHSCRWHLCVNEYALCAQAVVALENVGAIWRRGALMLESPRDFLLSPSSNIRPDRVFERSGGQPCHIAFLYELFNTGVFVAAMTVGPTPRSIEQPFNVENPKNLTIPPRIAFPSNRDDADVAAESFGKRW